MVTTKIANLKQGRPPSQEKVPIGTFSDSAPITLKEAAERMNVSRNSVQRAGIVRARGVPELHCRGLARILVTGGSQERAYP